MMARFVVPDREQPLDLDRYMELACGPHPPVDDPEGEPVSVWGSDDERRDDWGRHKDREPLATQCVRERRRGGLLWAEERYS